MTTRLRKSWPDLDFVRACVDYNAETGALTHKRRDLKMFPDGIRRNAVCKAWNARNAGKPWGCPGKSGHIHGRVKDVDVYAQQVAWALWYGEWPTLHVNHINGDPADNRIKNLRLADQAAVTRNTSMHGHNTSGVTGVYFCTTENNWRAAIGKKKLGRFYTFADAVAARQSAEREMGYHRNHGKRPSRREETS